MTKSTIIKQQDRQLTADSQMITLRDRSFKKQYSAYEAPTVKEFLWVIGVFALLTALSWITYYKFG